MPRILLLDNFDSFTWNLVDYFMQLGTDVVVKRNNLPLADFIEGEYDGVVLSPGPGAPTTAGNLMEVINHYFHRLPLLGICLGHQALGTYFGAGLARAERPMHGKISLVSCHDREMFGNIPEKTAVVRYHSLVLQDLPPTLQVTAKAVDNQEIMALKHASLPIWGLQFHPEAILTQHGMPMLRNWLHLLRPNSGIPATEKYMHHF